MENNMIKIAVWAPSLTLLNNIKKLDFSHEVIGIFDKKNTYAASEGYKVYEPKDILSIPWDFILINFEDFRNTRKLLNEDYGIPLEKIYTFEEFWVKGCEEAITEKYHQRWDKLHQAKINIFEGKNILIIGGSSGIGKECAHCFLANGGNVVIAGRDAKRMQEICDEYRPIGNIKYILWDVREFDHYQEKFSETLKLADGRIDIFVNSAGVLDDSRKDFFHVTQKDFDRVIETNLKAVYFLCQMFARYFIDQKIKGHIVNVASSLGFLPTVKPYAISKWGIIGLTKGLGMNLAEYGIIVNGIAPGEVATPILNWSIGNCPARRASKIGRVAFPCEVAETIAHLAGYTGEHFVGEVVLCDGGDKVINLRL